MTKLWSLLIFATVITQVFCANLRFKRQKDEKLDDKYGVMIIDEIDQEVNPTATTGNTGLSERECLRSCPVTAEYNPVCGSNDVTYPNPGRLICAQSCGVNVTFAKPNRCPVTTPAPT